MLDHSTIVAAVAPVLAARGLDLYDIELAGGGGARVLRVLVAPADPAAALDLDALGGVSEAISHALDAPEITRELAGSYALEVSSRGLERPLRRPEHYRGAVGETLSVKARDADRIRGTLRLCDDTGFELALDDGTSRRFAYDDIEKARTVFEWGASESTSKPSGSSRAKSVREVARR